MAVIIDLHNIVKTYRVKKAKTPFLAIDRASLSIENGEVFGLLGSNGAGKTTLIKIMAGLLEPNGGTGKVLGYDIYKEHKKIRAMVSLVAPTADVGTDNNLTVRQNLEFWAVVYDLEKTQRKSRIDEMLDFLGLREYEHHWPMSISAGNRQKLAIARSLLVKNPILFLDEPTVKLDARGAEAVRSLVKKINSEFGTTIILCTHYIFEAEELCGRFAIMHKGRIKCCDTVENLRGNLKRYDELLVSGSGLNTETICAINSLPFVVAADLQSEDPQSENLQSGDLQSTDYRFNGASKNTVIIQSDNLKNHLNEILKLLLDKNVKIHSIETKEPALEDIFIDTIEGGNNI